jgi:LysM repeat protein
MKRFNSSIVLLMMVLAIVLAIGLLLVGRIVMDRPDSAAEAALPEGVTTYPISVEGQDVLIFVDPNQRPIIVVPTAVPVPVVVEQSQPETAVDTTSAEPAADTAVQSGATGGVPADHVTFILYTVQPGDTLFRIAQNHITSIPLMAKHGISSVNIVPGNQFNLPVGDAAACPGAQPYVVLAGDTAFGISSYYGITLEQLQAMNNLDANYSLYETQVICVP